MNGPLYHCALTHSLTHSIGQDACVVFSPKVIVVVSMFFFFFVRRFSVIVLSLVVVVTVFVVVVCICTLNLSIPYRIIEVIQDIFSRLYTHTYTRISSLCRHCNVFIPPCGVILHTIGYVCMCVCIIYLFFFFCVIPARINIKSLVKSRGTPVLFCCMQLVDLMY